MKNYFIRKLAGFTLIFFLITCVSSARMLCFVPLPQRPPPEPLAIDSYSLPSSRILDRVTQAKNMYARVQSWAFGTQPDLSDPVPVLAIFDDRRSPVPSCYSSAERRVYVGMHASLDDLAHEIGHCFVDLIKPGFSLGAVKIIHEAIADMTAVLTVYRDAASSIRVLRATRGNLRRESEATIIEGFLYNRSACCSLTLDQIGFDPCRVTLPEIAIPNSLCDPHFVSQVLTSALYDVFCGVFEEAVNLGTPVLSAVQRSADVTGRLMFRALLFVGEHRVSLRDYASGLLLADEYLFNQRYRGILAPILIDRGLFDSKNGAELQNRNAAGPLPFRVEIEQGLSSRSLLARISELDERLVDFVKTIPADLTLDRYDIPLLFHRHNSPFPLFVDIETIEVDSDRTTPEGFRVIRLRYICPLDEDTRRAHEIFSGGSEQAAEEASVVQTAFASLIFDTSGNLLEINADRPMPALLKGYL